MKRPFTCLFAFIVLAASVHAEPLLVKTVEIDGKSVGRKLKYNIVLPRNYDTSTERYPVLYLLHGLTSNYRAWARLRVPEYAADYDLIVVMPDVGNSWYVNWAKSDEGQQNRWEDFIVKDLISHVDSTYRTIARREGRAINGLSMGGYGAITLGLKHPDLFCSIGSHSGALAFAQSVGKRMRDGQAATPRREPSKTAVPEIGIEGFSSQAERTPKGKLFDSPSDCDAADPFKLVLDVPKEKLPHIYIDCGTEDRLVGSAHEFAKVLMEKKVPFTYAESAGGHSGPYWAREVGHSMAVQHHIIRRELAKADRAAK